MALTREQTRLKQALETYGKQIDVTVTAGGEYKTTTGETLYIEDAFWHDKNLTVTARRKNILNLGHYSAFNRCSIDTATGVVSSNIDNYYYSSLYYTYFNDEIMEHRGQPLTFSVKSVPEGTVISIVIYGTRSNGSTYQEFSGLFGQTSVSGVIAEDFTNITQFELRLNRKSTTHTSTAVFEELQVEFNDTATEYAPYIEDLSSVSVTRRGRNLFNVDKYTRAPYYIGDGTFKSSVASKEEYIGIDITDIWDIAYALGQKITISFDLRAEKEGLIEIYALGQKRITWQTINATTEWQRFSCIAELSTAEAIDNACNLSFYGAYGSGRIPSVKNIQIELGEPYSSKKHIYDDYENYNGQTTAIDENGNVMLPLTIAPCKTVIYSNTPGLILTATYRSEVEYTSEKIVGTNISHEGSLLASIMKQAEIEFDGMPADFHEQMKGEKICVLLEVTAPGIEAHKKYGTFIVESANFKEETNSHILTCYDLLLPAMKPYQSIVPFPTEEGETSNVTLGDYLQAICNWLGVELATPTFTNSDVIIDGEKYDDTCTFRDVLTEIAQAAAGTIAIKNDKLYVLYPTNSDVTLDPSNLKSIDAGECYGPVNSVVIARTPQEDNIYKQVPGAENICEIKIENNQLMDSQREDFIDGIFNTLNGFSFVPYELESFGIGVLDICDFFTVEGISGNTYPFLHLSGGMEITQGIMEWSKGEVPKATKTEYKAASTTDRVLKQTILRVDKQEQEIQALVTNTENTKNELSGQMEAITKSVEQKITPEQMQIKITEAVEGIDSITTETGYTFDKDGLHIQKSGEEIENRIDNKGMYVGRGGDDVLIADAEGVKALNLTARQYLTIGTNSRLEDFAGNRTACFYIGG